MGVEAIDTSIDLTDLSDDVFEEETVKTPKHNVDARRRLEDKLEEMRLKRELRDFDFDD